MFTLFGAHKKRKRMECNLRLLLAGVDFARMGKQESGTLEIFGLKPPPTRWSASVSAAVVVFIMDSPTMWQEQLMGYDC